LEISGNRLTLFSSGREELGEGLLVGDAGTGGAEDGVGEVGFLLLEAASIFSWKRLQCWKNSITVSVIE